MREWRAKHARHAQATLSGTGAAMQSLQSRGLSIEQSREFVSQLIDSQAIAVTTINLFELFAAIFIVSAAIIWFAPKPKHAVALDADQ